MKKTRSKKHYNSGQKGCSKNCTRKHRHRCIHKRKVGGTAIYPSTSPAPLNNGNFFLNPQHNQQGGNCGCGLLGGSNNAFIGSPWKPDANTWLNSNHYPQNNYNTDIQGSIQNLGANRPFIGGKKKRGGNSLSSLLPQDLVNFGRIIPYNLGSAYNTISGSTLPTNPLPWKGHMPNLPNISTIKSFNY